MNSNSPIRCYARIYTFRSFVDSGWFPLGPRVSIIGSNGSGKTSLLEALHAFSNGGESLKDELQFALTPHTSFCDLVVPLYSNPEAEELRQETEKRSEQETLKGLLLVRRDRKESRHPFSVFYRDASGLGSFEDVNSDWLNECTGDAKTSALQNQGWSKLAPGVNVKGRKTPKYEFDSIEHFQENLSKGSLYAKDEVAVQGFALIPRFIKVQDTLNIGSETVVSKMSESQKLDSIKKWPEDLDENSSALATLLGAVWEGDSGANVTALPGTELKTVGLQHDTPNSIIQDFWDEKTEMLLDVNSKFGRPSGWSKVKLSLKCPNQQAVNPHHLSRGGKWFFGFLSIALAARAHAKRFADDVKEKAADKMKSGGLPVMLLFDEPATFLDSGRQRSWLDLVEALSSPRGGVDELRHYAPWFGFTTHASALIRRGSQIVVCVAHCDRKRDTVDIQQNSSLVFSEKRIASKDRYHELLSCLCYNDNFIGEPVNRIVLEGLSDRDYLNCVIEVIFNPGHRPQLHPIALHGVAAKNSWPMLRDRYLRDPQWNASTKGILLLFDADTEGKDGAERFKEKITAFKSNENIQSNWTVEKYDMAELTGIPGATVEDLIPKCHLKKFFETTFQFCPNEAFNPSSSEMFNQASQHLGLKQGEVKAKFLLFCKEDKKALSNAFDRDPEFTNSLKLKLSSLPTY